MPQSRWSPELPDPKVDLTKWGLSKISPAKMLSFWTLPTAEVDLTKRRCSEIRPIKMLSFWDSPTTKVDLTNGDSR